MLPPLPAAQVGKLAFPPAALFLSSSTSFPRPLTESYLQSVRILSCQVQSLPTSPSSNQYTGGHLRRLQVTIFKIVFFVVLCIKPGLSLYIITLPHLQFWRGQSCQLVKSVSIWLALGSLQKIWCLKQ